MKQLENLPKIIPFNEVYDIKNDKMKPILKEDCTQTYITEILFQEKITANHLLEKKVIDSLNTEEQTLERFKHSTVTLLNDIKNKIVDKNIIEYCNNIDFDYDTVTQKLRMSFYYKQ